MVMVLETNRNVQQVSIIGEGPSELVGRGAHILGDRLLPYFNWVHCCMKCPQILREKTSSEKYTVISLRIKWRLSAEGNAFRKCQQMILPLIIINVIIFKGQN